MLSPTACSSTEFVENYVDILESLPRDLQRHITQLRELDCCHADQIERIGKLLTLYHEDEDGGNRRRWLNKIQRLLVSSQQCGDEKLSLITQMNELIEARNVKISHDAAHVDPSKEPPPVVENGGVPRLRGGPEKHCEEDLVLPWKSVAPSSGGLGTNEKPKRIRRVRNLEHGSENCNEKVKPTKVEVAPPEVSGSHTPSRDNDTVAMETNQQEKSVRERDHKKDVKEKEKEKEQEEEPKEERKDEKRAAAEKKLDKSSGKVSKKPHVKMKKKKLKKEISATATAESRGSGAAATSTPAAVEAEVEPEEPTYCVCERVSFGDMIGCDNDECPIEWFHFDCVNLSHKPKGRWYCPGCTTERRQTRKT